jgi:hypothetical protein
MLLNYFDEYAIDSWPGEPIEREKEWGEEEAPSAMSADDSGPAIGKWR